MDVQPYTADDALWEQTRADRTTRTRVDRPTETAVVLGRASKPAVEINVDACTRDQVPLLRRRGGGCAVVLDPGNLVVSAAQHAPGIGDNGAHFQRLTTWLLAGLAAAGVDGLRQAGISDLARGDRKVGGACLYRGRDTLLYAVTLLVEPDLDALSRYLAHPPREPEYRAGRRHREFVTTLGAGIGPDATPTLLTRLNDTLRAEALEHAGGRDD